MQINYADTLLNIRVTGPLVRLEFGTVEAVQGTGKKQELRATPTQQVVMPLEGFARAFGMQDGVIKKLLQQGVLKKKELQPGPAEAAGAEKK